MSRIKLMNDTQPTSTVATRRASARRTAAVLGVVAILVFIVAILNAMSII